MYDASFPRICRQKQEHGGLTALTGGSNLRDARVKDT